MQYITSRNTPKLHKMNTTDTPWMQPSDQYYNSHSSDAIITDTDTDLYMSDNTSKHSNRSRNSTSDMCVEKNTEGKPPYSYATLIKYAIERSSENKLTLSQIYQWVIDHYPYYGSAGSGWKNSIRHNLSLNKSFVRVPRPVNEPGKGSYWTVDQFAVDTEQRARTTVRGRSSRSSSDTSLHSHRANSDPWLHNSRDSRSLSTDAGVTSTNSSAASAATAAAQAAAAARRTSQFGYCSHPYAGYERNNFNHHQYGYPNYHYYQQQQRMPSHEALLNARQHSSVTYSLPANANLMNNTMYQQPFYSHRQSCPDLTSISSYPETNMLPNFSTTTATPTAAATTTTTNTAAAAAAAAAAATNEIENACDNKAMYSTPQPYYVGDTQKILGSFVPSSSSSPIKGNARSNANNNDPTLSSFFKEFDGSKEHPGLPSPVLSSSNCSSTSPSASSQHLSVADPLSMVTRHPSPVTTTSAAPANRLTSPYYSSSSELMMGSKEECLTSPSSPLVMTDNSVAYMVSQQHTASEDSLVSSSTASSQHDSPQPSTTDAFSYQQNGSPQPSMKYSQSFFQNENARFDYQL